MRLSPFPQRKRRVRAAGFSLVELLVVIGIVTVLLSLLMPAVAGMRARGEELKCQATLRAIGQAAQIHVNEHNGYLPLAGRHWETPGATAEPAALKDTGARRYIYYTEDGRRRPVPVTVALAVSLGTKVRLDSREGLEADMQTQAVRQHFKCPSQLSDLSGVTQIDAEGMWEAPPEWSSYVFNEAILGQRQKETNPNPPMGNVSRIKHTSTVMLAMDGRPRTGNGGRLLVFEKAPDWSVWDFHQACMAPGGEEYGREALDFTRHRWRANVLFVDGHVETVPMTAGGLSAVGVSRGIGG